MLGMDHKVIWDLCVREFINQQPGETCAKLLIKEYVDEGNYEKAKEYADMIGFNLPDFRGKVKQLRSEKSESSASGEVSSDEKTLSFWRRIAIATAVVAIGLKVAREIL